MKVLVVGANYGLLLTGMLIEREIRVDVLGTDQQTDILNKEGFLLKTKNKSWNFNPSKSLNFLNNFENYDYDLVILAIQEPSLLSLKLSDLISQIAKRKIPTMSIMNIPFYQFIENIIGIKNIKYPEKIYSSLKISNLLNADLIINSNPEPQVFSEDKFNQLCIRLGGVFRCSPFQMLKKDFISKLTNNIDNGLPAKIKEYKSSWVSLSKLPMLITGNYRCLENYQLRSIGEAVRHEAKKSEKIYNQVVDIMKKAGAGRESIIPFKAYLNASTNLDAPSSVCRSIVNGSNEVERVDRLVQAIGKSVGVISKEINHISENIDNSIKKFSLKT